MMWVLPWKISQMVKRIGTNQVLQGKVRNILTRQQLTMFSKDSD